jgi:hypothetical protein
LRTASSRRLRRHFWARVLSTCGIHSLRTEPQRRIVLYNVEKQEFASPRNSCFTPAMDNKLHQRNHRLLSTTNASQPCSHLRATTNSPRFYTPSICKQLLSSWHTSQYMSTQLTSSTIIKRPESGSETSPASSPDSQGRLAHRGPSNEPGQSPYSQPP